MNFLSGFLTVTTVAMLLVSTPKRAIAKTAQQIDKIAVLAPVQVQQTEQPSDRGSPRRRDQGASYLSRASSVGRRASGVGERDFHL
ncbi:MAG: hypothetical protein ICV55_02275 [Coleofasciculus sp. C3-bin4]|nr:hypothetical protein [Coleofasciculus sp. C3-bin4]